MGRRRSKQSRSSASAEPAANDADWRSLHLAARDGDLARVQGILHRVSARDSGVGEFERNLAVPVRITAELTEFVNSRDPSGKTALHEACAHGHAEVSRLLLSLGAIPTARKANGFTPLLSAAAGGHAECARLLLAHMRAGERARGGAEEAGWRNAEGGRTGGWRAADRCGETAVHVAARAGAEEVVGMLLEASEKEEQTGVGEDREKGITGADHGTNNGCRLVNARTRNGRTPLHSACLHGHVAVCDLLLRHGAEPTARDSSGSEPIHEAAAGGHVAVIDLLTAGQSAPGQVDVNTMDAAASGRVAVTDSLTGNLVGVDVNVDVNTRDAAGATPMHCAAAAGHVDAMRALSQRDADLDPEDNAGTTPLYWAASRGHVAAVEWLLKHQSEQCHDAVSELPGRGTDSQQQQQDGNRGVQEMWGGVGDEGRYSEGRDSSERDRSNGGGNGSRTDCSRRYSSKNCSSSSGSMRGSSRRSALHVAAGWGHVDVCSVLLNSGRFDPLERDSEGLTVIDVAERVPDKAKGKQLDTLMTAHLGNV